MGLLDRLLGIGEVAKSGYELGEEIAKLDPFGLNTPPFLAPIPGSNRSAAPQGVQYGGAAAELGGQGMAFQYGDMGFGNGGDFPLTVTGPRRIVPYSGGIIPSGYRVAQRAARRPTPGYPGGTYLVPRRSMNPLNPRALMRAERRMNSFSTWVKRHFRIAAAMPKRRKGGKFTRRRK